MYKETKVHLTVVMVFFKHRQIGFSVLFRQAQSVSRPGSPWQNNSLLKGELGVFFNSPLAFSVPIVPAV